MICCFYGSFGVSSPADLSGCALIGVHSAKRVERSKVAMETQKKRTAAAREEEAGCSVGSRKKKKSRVAGGDELVAAEMGNVYRSGELLGTIMKHWRYLYTSYWSMYVAVLGGVHVAVANGYLMQ